MEEEYLWMIIVADLTLMEEEYLRMQMMFVWVLLLLKKTN
jgi:hypothetical protein